MKNNYYNLKTNFINIFICLIIVILVITVVFYIKNFRSFDISLLNFIQVHLSWYPVPFALAISNFGGDYCLLWPQLAAVSTLFSHKKYLEGILLVVFTQIAWHGVDFIKDFIHRERPCADLCHGYSFPSGHACTTMFFYGALIYFVLKYVKNKFWMYFLITIFSIFIFFVAVARLKLNMHFLSDIIAGLSIGLILLNAYIITLKLIRH